MEREEARSPVQSESDSESLSLSLASPPPPLIQPGLHPAHRNTNFFIDDILRPDFGCRKDPRANDSDRAGRPCPDSIDGGSSCTSSSVSSESSTEKSSRVTAEETEQGAESGSGVTASTAAAGSESKTKGLLWPAWVYCTRYSDRPSSGPRTRRLKKKKSEVDSKRPRTAFTAEQLQRLKAEFQQNRYITEQRRQALAHELSLNESQIKIWFQNKRAKIKKASGLKNSLAVQLMAQGLYNHSTTTVQEDSD